MEDRRLTVSEECVEPELLGPGASPRGESANGPRVEEAFAGPLPEKPGLLTRLKMLIAGVLAFIGLGLFILGAILTSTIIGAIIGIPLMLLGAVVFFLLFKLLTLGSKNAFVFRRFP